MGVIGRNGIRQSGFTNLSAVLLLVVAIVVTIVVSRTIKDRKDIQSKAQTAPQNVIYLNPNSQTVTVGSELTVTIRVNTIELVNAVQADISYPTDKLTVTSIDTTTSAFDLAVQSDNTNGLIRVARAASTAVSSDNVVAVLHFQANNVIGQADLIFAPTTEVDSEASHTNVITQMVGGSYTIAQPQPSPTPVPSPVADTIAPQIAITSPQDSSVVARRGQVVITANASDNVGVSRVTFSVNGTLLCTDATAPYSCNWKVPGKPNAAYTIEAKAFDAANNASSATAHVTSQ